MRRRTFIAAGAFGVLGVAACAGRVPSPLPDDVAERAFPPLGRNVEVDGLPVHVLERGEGSGPPVILIHGASVNLRDWSFSLVEQLARTNRVIAMDRPGFGYSKRGPGDWPPARQAAHLRKAALAMGVEKPIVVGHSWGGAVAMAWGLDFPDDVTGIVPVSGATMPWGPGATVFQSLGIGRIGVDYYQASLTRRAEEGAIEDFVRRAFTPQTPPPGYIDYVGAPLSLREGTLEANAQDLSSLHLGLREMAPRYPQMTVPVESIHGERDWLLDVEQHVGELSAVLPNVQTAVAQGVGHMAHHARPDLLEAAIARLSGRSV
jgi:pimeloyl-ACP methyl ester carboxylesterase